MRQVVVSSTHKQFLVIDAGAIMEDKPNTVTESETSKSGNSQPGSSQEPQMNGASNRLDNPSHNELPEGLVTVSCTGPTNTSTKEDVDMADAEISEQITSIKHRLMERAERYGVPQLERLYMQVVKGVIAVRSKEAVEDHRLSILRYLLKFVEDDDNF